MEIKYKNLLSPIRIGNTVLRNRFIASPSMPMFMQGTEKYPSPGMIKYYTRKAMNGPALIVVGGGLMSMPEVFFTMGAPNWPTVLDREGWQARNLWSQLIESLHFAGAKALMHLRTTDGKQIPDEYDVSGGANPVYFPEGACDIMVERKEITREMLEARAEDLAQNAYYWKICGFDGIMLHCSYRCFLEGRFLSKLTNRRTDEFGGSAENKARYVRMICERIKELCGKDFIIQMDYSGTDARPGGNEIEDSIEIIHALEDVVDIVEIRCGDMDYHHTIGTVKEKTPFLKYAAAIKTSNPKCLISCGGGFQDLELCEEAIASGKVDLISAARAWICDPDYGKKAYEGKGEEVIPCVRCNKCHGNMHLNQLGVNMCAVNPTTTCIYDKLDQLVQDPGPKQKVAVIGGGPGGMQAALTAANRGHEVTLFEKSDKLGGALKHADHCADKWPLRDYKDYQIRHTLAHENITVKFNAEVTPDMIDGKYDRVIVAIGGNPLYPPIKGIKEAFVTYAEDAFGYHEKYGQKVVVIGGGEIGVDAGVYFAENGHDVFVIEMNPKLAMTAQPVHYWSMIMRQWESLPNFKYAVNARVLEVSKGKVTYQDGNGCVQEILCDSIILAAGKVNRIDEALAFTGTSRYVEQVGDCMKVADLREANRQAYAAATRF